jgi:hypothetical protein
MRRKENWREICFICKDYKQGSVHGVCLLQDKCKKIIAIQDQDLKEASRWSRLKVESDRDEIKRWKRKKKT